MGSIERRLGRLEERAPAREDEGAATSREVMRRLTVEELRAYADVLRRMRGGEEPDEDDGLILRRVEELYEEVRNEH